MEEGILRGRNRHREREGGAIKACRSRDTKQKREKKRVERGLGERPITTQLTGERCWVVTGDERPGETRAHARTHTDTHTPGFYPPPIEFYQMENPAYSHEFQNHIFPTTSLEKQTIQLKLKKPT